MRSFQFWVFCGLSALAFCHGASALAQANPDTGIVGVCRTNCNIPSPPVNTGPPQPSAEEIRRQRETQDLSEAADDAFDKGIAAFRRGDFSGAVRKFEESLRYDPDNSVTRQNLAKARERLNYFNGLAARQAVASASGQLDPTFDGRKGSKDLGGIAVSPSAVSAGVATGDPLVPLARRTPAITAHESQRTAQRSRIAAINAEVQKLNPATHGTKIAELKQQRTTAERQVQFLNFSINEALKAPTTPPKPKK